MSKFATLLALVAVLPQAIVSLTAQEEADVATYMQRRTTAGCPGDAAVQTQAETDVASDGCTVKTYA